MYLNRNLVAIDVGASSIKVIDMAGTGEKTLISIGYEPLPQRAVDDGSISDFTTVQRSLKALLSRLGVRIRGRRAAICLGGSSVLIKKVLFPNSDDLELASLIENEAEQHFQYDINDLYTSWYLFPPGQGDQRAALIVGAKKSLVEQHMDLAKSIGFKIGVVDCSVFCLSNLFEAYYGIINKLLILVNVGATSTLVVFICRGQHLYNREIPFGGQRYTQLIAKSLQVSMEEAEAVKIQLSFGISSVSSALLNEIKALNNQFAAEIQLTIDFFLQNEDLTREFSGVEGVYLSGGASATFGLAEALQTSIKTEVHPINPFRQMQMKKSALQNFEERHVPLYSIVSGLALREFDDQY